MSRGYQAVPLLIVMFVLALTVTASPISSAASTPPIPESKVDPGLLASLTANGQAEFIIFLTDQADLSEAKHLTTKGEKGSYAYEELSRVADRSQAAITDYLDSLSVEYRTYWVANMIWVRGDEQLLQTLAPRTDIKHFYANPHVQNQRWPVWETAKYEQTIDPIEWNIHLIRAPEVWTMGYTGQNVVIGGQDTGYDWNHPALKQQYRGWDGQTASHDYHWYDAIHTGDGICGSDAAEPCDDDGHGTHTMGIMVGDDGAGRKIGVAPGSKWIGCRNMDDGVGTPITYSECYQWFIAPTDLNGNNPDHLMAPEIINNSWSCPPWEGCKDSEILRTVVENVRSAGILTVHAAGNSGPDCGTVNWPAAIYDASFTIGATTSTDNITTFSSRGPSIVSGDQFLKPDVVAPGEWVRSSLPGGGYGILSGTSMAAPHVAGLAALAISADPSLAANVDKLEQLITLMAIPKTTLEQSCAGIVGTQIPNNTYGYGRIDALRTISLLTGEKLYFPIFRSYQLTSPTWDESWEK